mgnify:CR=1 FL=1
MRTRYNCDILQCMYTLVPKYWHSALKYNIILIHVSFLLSANFKQHLYMYLVFSDWLIISCTRLSISCTQLSMLYAQDKWKHVCHLCATVLWRVDHNMSQCGGLAKGYQSYTPFSKFSFIYIETVKNYFHLNGF